jgi:succinate dehydrogenase / fumarate reductase membrane anchor subunit
LSGGTAVWLFQRITGVVLFAGLLVHFYMMHFVGPENLSYDAVAARLDTSGWIMFNVLFLVSALYHGFSGLWGMALEYVRSEMLLKASKALLLLAAFGLCGVGVYVLSLG